MISVCLFRLKLCITSELELALQFLVDVVLVELRVGRLKVKVLLELHHPIPAHVHFASAAAAPPAPATHRLGASRQVALTCQSTRT